MEGKREQEYCETTEWRQQSESEKLRSEAGQGVILSGVEVK